MFKKVTKDEFDVLSKYHPWEVRYYVDMSRTVKPKRSKKARPSANGDGTAEEPRLPMRAATPYFKPGEKREWQGKHKKDALLALGKVSLGNIRKNAPMGTITDKLVRAVDEIYHGNVFSQFRRTTLTKKLVEATKISETSISPVISKLITARKLRVVEENATSALDVPKAADAAAAH